MSEEVKELTPEEAQKKAREVNQERIDARLAQMEAIADNAEKGRPDDIEGVEKEDPTEKAERIAREEDEATARALQTEGADADKTDEKDSDTKTVNGETHYRQIINGAERWQTIKQIRETAQKVESGDEYLRQAAESVRNTARLALSKDEPVRVEKDDLKKLLASAVLGDEEAIEKLASALSARPSEVTPDVLRAVDQRLSFRTELAALESEQREILDDPDLSELFQSRLAKLKQEAPDTSLAVAYRTIGKGIKDKFGISLKGSKTADKLERKRTLPQVPSAAARQSAPLEEEGEEDVSTVIERMAKARGLSPIVHSRR